MTRSDLDAPAGATPRRRGRSAALLAAVIAVPLAVAGLVAGAVGGADERLDTIPAIVVNNDEMVTTTTPDGQEQPVLAGRLLVTELTGDGGSGFDWTISNDEEAAAKLADGEAYAVLTIPSDFSASVTSLAGDRPMTAALDIRTDDAHSYLAGAVGSTVGDAIATAFGHELTTQYLEGLFGNLVEVGGSLGDAADGAGQLADGAGSLATGLDRLAGGIGSAADGTAQAADGAAAYAVGVDRYTSGVEQLAGGLGPAASGAADAAAGARTYVAGVAEYTGGVDALARGLGTLADETSQLGALGTGVGDYVDGVTALSDNFAQLQPGLVAIIDQNFTAIAAAYGIPDATCETESLPAELVQLCGLRAGVVGAGAGAAELATQGQPLKAGAAGLGELQEGIAASAAGAAKLAGGSAPLRAGGGELVAGLDELSAGLGQLSGGASQAAAGSPALRDGADGIASGVDGIANGLVRLEDGASASADGATQLADGTTELADGLAEGADGTASLEGLDPEETAGVVADPVVAQSTRDNEIASFGEIVAVLIGPIGLWLGAMTLFLVFRPFGRAALASTAPTTRIVARTLFRGSLIGLAQAALVVALMHVVLGVGWNVLPQTLAFSALLAVVFTALHALLSAWLGRIGTVVSLVLVVLQLAASGGVYPLEIVSGPYRAISPFLPLTWAVDGMQAIVAGVGGAPVWGAVGVLVLFGLLGIAGTALAVSRQRGIRSTTRFVPATA
ncbi:YhgE/Pip family protein [Agromyces sp. SYSU T0242]|uniref:YhgE/Pip family protein n=1 Tax=Agromyces litoreus TaxID=3158561 RepID=UPI003395433F